MDKKLETAATIAASVLTRKYYMKFPRTVRAFLDEGDLRQIGLLAVVRKADHYSGLRGASELTWAYHIVENTYRDLLKHYSYAKRGMSCSFCELPSGLADFETADRDLAIRLNIERLDPSCRRLIEECIEGVRQFAKLPLNVRMEIEEALLA